MVYIVLQYGLIMRMAGSSRGCQQWKFQILDVFLSITCSGSFAANM